MSPGEQGPPGGRPDGRPDSFSASRAVLDALGLGAAPTATPAEAHRPPPAAWADPPPAALPAAPYVEAPATTGRSTGIEFAPRLGARRVVGLLGLVTLVATGGASYLAYVDPRPFTLSVAATLLAVTLVLYGVRAGSTPARLSIRAGQLEVRRGERREVFDLTSHYARVEVVGTPGRRGWKVLFGRFGRDPFVVDGSMVDPAAFTAALQQHRPGLRLTGRSGRSDRNHRPAE